MDIRNKLKNSRIILDGGMGTLLQEMGLKPGEAPEMWNLTNPEKITRIHKEYYIAGSDVVNTNTFGVNPLKYDDKTVEAMISAAFVCADLARREAGGENISHLILGRQDVCLNPLGICRLRRLWLRLQRWFQRE